MTNYRVDYLSLGSDGIFFALRNFSLLTYFARSGSTSLDRIVKLSRLIRARKSGCWIVGSRESPNRFRGSVPDTATWIDEIAKHRRRRDILFSLSLSPANGRPASRFAICERKRNYRPNGKRRVVLPFLPTRRSRISNCVSAHFRTVSLRNDDPDDSNILRRTWPISQSITPRSQS